MVSGGPRAQVPPVLGFRDRGLSTGLSSASEATCRTGNRCGKQGVFLSAVVFFVFCSGVPATKAGLTNQYNSHTTLVLKRMSGSAIGGCIELRSRPPITRDRRLSRVILKTNRYQNGLSKTKRILRSRRSPMAKETIPKLHPPDSALAWLSLCHEFCLESP